MGLVVRGPAIGAAQSHIKAAVAAVDPNQPVAVVMMMADFVDRARSPYRFSALVIGCLAGAAFVLAMSGIYGLTAFVVGTRVRELGVRLALGATAASVVSLVLRQIAALVGAGLCAGLLGALLTARLLRSLIVGSGPFDPLAIAGAVAALAGTALAAGLLPAMRAARVDPSAALKHE